MAQLQVFAEVVGEEVISGPLQETGKSPGRPLREYIELSGGTYVYDMPVPATSQHRLRAVAELTGDERLGTIAFRGSGTQTSHTCAMQVFIHLTIQVAR